MAEPPREPGIGINLIAVVMAFRGDEPAIFASGTSSASLPGLPSGPFEPIRHRTLELGLRNFAEGQSGLALGYVEQLYTFGDRGRIAADGAVHEPHMVSIGYLALTRMPEDAAAHENFRSLYSFFPWEDWRGGAPALLREVIVPHLAAWAADRFCAESDARHSLTRAERIALAFGRDGLPFDEEKVLERYELLYEAGLVDEAGRDGRAALTTKGLGQPMLFDHRRILATALGRIRGKLKYRPVIFEMMPPSFTLTDLQMRVEAMSGHHLHKQNFRRLVETGGLVEPTGAQTTTRGRPAALFSFRRDVLTERPAPGLRLGRSS